MHNEYIIIKKEEKKISHDKSYKQLLSQIKSVVYPKVYISFLVNPNQISSTFMQLLCKCALLYLSGVQYCNTVIVQTASYMALDKQSDIRVTLRVK